MAEGVLILALLAGCDDALALSIRDHGCARARVPSQGYPVGRIVVQPASGTRDINLFAAFSPLVEPECGRPVDLNLWYLVFDAQEVGLDWRLPDGAAIELGGDQSLWLQSAGPVEVRLERAKSVRTRVSALWAGRRDFSIPPGSQEFVVEGTCTLDQDLDLIAILGDVRSHARLFTVNRYDGLTIEEIYRLEGGARPTLAILDPPIRVPAHGGLQYLCHYDNPSAQPISFGPDPVRNEHCNLFVHYLGSGVECLEQTGGW